MDSQAYEGTSLPYVLVKPPGFSAGAGWPLVILAHGRGASMYDLANLAPAIDGSGYVYAFPNGPYRWYGVGYAWVGGQPGVEELPEGSPGVEDLIDGFMTEVMRETGTPAGSVVLGGFSQGGGLTYRYGLSRPDLFAGLAILSGVFRDPEQLKLPEGRDQPIFIAHGTQDQLLAIEMGRQARDYLQQAGYNPAYHEYPMGHEITPDVIRDLTLWLHETLSPKK
jgi:phospholipase/carboxylesterase